MTYAAPPISTETEQPSSPVSTASPPESWDSMRDDSDIQFAPVEIPPEPPREPSWLEKMLNEVFGFLGDLFAPIGHLLAGSWPVLQWILLGALIAFVLYLIFNLIGPLAKRNRDPLAAGEEPEWTPDRTESLALLEDADRLAAEGLYDEATHLLLKRSVGQIAAARPDWVEPSSTARELAALPALSESARRAFGTIAERVERSLFALRSLDAADWEAARAAYADFALVRIGAAA